MATAVALVREHGLLDAKEMARANLSVLTSASPKVAARLQAEAAEAAATAAEAAAGVGAPVPRELAAAVEAVKRSPLMLALPGDHPGLEALAGLVSCQPPPCCFYCRLAAHAAVLLPPPAEKFHCNFSLCSATCSCCQTAWAPGSWLRARPIQTVADSCPRPAARSPNSPTT